MDRTVFSDKRYEALRAFSKIVGLDCGLHHAGSLAVFQVNAPILVHQASEHSANKTPFVQEITQAFSPTLATRHTKWTSVLKGSA